MERFGRRELKEIREINERETNLAYKEIKPQTDITLKEATDFWDNLFEDMSDDE